MDRKIKFKYIGGGNAIIGIPARDIYEDEVEEWGGEKVILSTGLYELADSGEPIADSEIASSKKRSRNDNIGGE